MTDTAKTKTVPARAAKIVWLDQRATSFALGLTGLGLILRLIGLGARRFWFDETISVVYAQQDWGDVLRLNAGDNHPPGYYLALKAWIDLFGSSETMVRLLSVIPGTIAIWLVWLISQQLLPKQSAAGLLATGLAVLSPFQIYFSQEARNYSLLEMTVLLATYFWLRGLESNRWRDWLGLGLAGILGLVCNLTMAFYLAGIGLYCLFRADKYWKRGILQRLLVTGVGTGLVSGLLLLPKLTGRLDAIKGNFWIPRPDLLTVLSTFYTFIFGTSPVGLVLWAFGLSLILLLIVAGLVVTSLITKEDNRLGIASWLLVGPISLIIIVSYLFQPLYLDKALIGCAPFYYVLIGWAIARTAPRRNGWVLAGVPTALALVIALVGLPQIYSGEINPRYIVRYDPPQTDAYLQQNAQPGDTVVTATDISWLPLFYYDTKQNPPIYPIKDYPDPNIFQALLDQLHTHWVSLADLDGQHSGRTWLVLEVDTPTDAALSTTPLDPTQLDWMHSPDWQQSLLAHFNQQHKYISSVVIDHLMLVLYQN